MKEGVPRDSEKQQSLVGRISRLFLREPKDQQQLVEVLHEAEQNNLLDADSLDMIEGVLDVSAIRVDDIMIPRSQMVVINEDSPIKDVITIITASGHSRYPVVDENFEHVVGILIVKDLLQFGFTQESKTVNLKEILHPPMVVPESRRLDILLREFRTKHVHMGIVTDEYGSVAGLVTIEDILEQIVGDIEDEHDVEEEKPGIIKQGDNQFLVQAQISIEDFNEYFHSEVNHPEFNTIAGMVMNRFGRMPKSGEVTMIAPFEFTVADADERMIKAVRVSRQSDDVNSE